MIEVLVHQEDIPNLNFCAPTSKQNYKIHRTITDRLIRKKKNINLQL